MEALLLIIVILLVIAALAQVFVNRALEQRVHILGEVLRDHISTHLNEAQADAYDAAKRAHAIRKELQEIYDQEKEP